MEKMEGLYHHQITKLSNNQIIIAVDGYSSCGKSTLARDLANAIGYKYIDTGAMYRAATLYLMENKIISKDNFVVEKIIQEIPDINLNAISSEKIRSLEVAALVSKVSAIPE